MIYIDSRGSGEKELYQLLQMRNLDVTRTKVESGDIVFSGIGLERKSVRDLVSSVTSGTRHMWTQLEVLKATYKKHGLIIEGFTNNFYKDSMLSGILYSITVGWGIPFFPTTSIYETAELIEMLYLKSEHKGDPTCWR